MALVALMGRKTPPHEYVPPDPFASKVEAWFSPNCEDALCQGISLAGLGAFIFLQQSAFENRRVAQTIVRAHARGAIVEAIFDRRCQGPRAHVRDLVQVGIKCWLDLAEHVVAKNVTLIGRLLPEYDQQPEYARRRRDPRLAGEGTTLKPLARPVPQAVYTGTFSLTADPESNAEDLVRLSDHPTMERYLADWRRHLGHSVLIGQ